MSIKQLSYDIHHQLTIHSDQIKRSHCRELIAAYFGFNSFASLESQGILYDQANELFEDEYYELSFHEQLDENKFSNRLIELAPKIPFLFAQSVIEQNLEKQNLYFLSFDKLCKFFILQFHDFEEYSSFKEYSLKHGYWYRKKIAGEQLSKAQLSFANEYEEELKRYQEYQRLITLANSKEHYKSYYCMSTFEDDMITKKALLEIGANKNDLYAMSELIETYGEQQYIIKAAIHGDYQYLEQLTRAYSESNTDEDKVNAYYFNHIAKLYGIDLTQSTAVGDGDYGYGQYNVNDDYHGPLYIDYVGIKLPSINIALKQSAIDKADNDFKNLTRT